MGREVGRRKTELKKMHLAIKMFCNCNLAANILLSLFIIHNEKHLVSLSFSLF